MSEETSDNRPIIILVLGILGIVTCAILGPVAYKMGKSYEYQTIMDGGEPDSLAKVGTILGMVGSALLVLQLIGMCLGFTLGFMSAFA